MNRRHTSSRLLVGLLLATGVSGAAQAALIDRGGGLIYDTDLNVTWLADANYAKTSGYDVDGRMTWSEATNWAANLSYYDSIRSVTYTDWRLPTTQQPDSTCSGQGGNAFVGFYGYGTGCTGSEMGHLFYDEFGGSVIPLSDPDLALFTNIKTTWAYWSGTEGVPAPSGDAWGFSMFSGDQGQINKASSIYAWAVRDGDVAAVPEAETYALMLAGLGLIGWRVRRHG